MTHSRGVGGIRTLVQTGSHVAFYMLIHWLVVGIRPASDQPIRSLVPVIRCEVGTAS